MLFNLLIINKNVIIMFFKQDHGESIQKACSVNIFHSNFEKRLV